MVYFINNNFVSANEATLHVSDLSIQRGYALFDFLRTRENVPLFFEDYLERFYKSSELLGLEPLHERTKLKEIIKELIGINNITEAGFKIILTGGNSTDGYEQATPNLIITQSLLQMPSHNALQNGLRLITHDYVRALPSIKSTNYLVGVWLQPKLKQQGADDVLYYSNNLISELPRSNFFIVDKNDVLITPKENVLYGITRKKVLDIARLKYKVEERSVTLEEVFNAKEAFVTSTTKRVQPVIEIDGKAINEGKAGSVTLDLFKAFVKTEQEYVLRNTDVTISK